MDKNSSGASGGIGFTGILQIVFIILKLCGVIDWSWWWVLAPMWISFVFAMVILLIPVIIARILNGRKQNDHRIFRWQIHANAQRSLILHRYRGKAM